MTVLEIMKKIKQCVMQETTEINASMEDGKNKMKMFMRHVHREYVLLRRIDEEMKEVRDSAQGKKALIIVEFKIKMQPMCYGQEIFCRTRGISWHGARVFHREDRMERANVGERAAQTELLMFVIDSIILEDITQDRIAVLSLMDAVIGRVRLELPQCKELWINIDNVLSG